MPTPPARGSDRALFAGQAAQVNEGGGGEDAQEHAQGNFTGHPSHRVQVGVGLLQGDVVDRDLGPIQNGDRFRLCLGQLRLHLVEEQVVTAHLKQLAEPENFVQVWDGAAALPLGHRLPGHPQLVGQLLLGPPGLFSQICDLIS